MARDLLIDVFRGIDLLEMQATEICDSSFFDHASYEEMNMNYADTIFPCFSFITGMTIRPNRKVSLRKSLQLVGLGIAFNGIPLLIQGDDLRIPGVLQRHGMSSIFLNNLIPLKLRDSIACPFVVTGIWYAISTLFSNTPANPFNNPEDTAQYKIDKAIFGNRTYHNHFDPEGLLGTFMTSLTVWSGYWFAKYNLSLDKSILLGILLLGLGYTISKISPKYAPISKPLWTPSFILTSNGWSILKFSLLKGLAPFIPTEILEVLRVFGSYSMEVYFVGELLMMILKYPFKSGKSLWNRGLQKLNTKLPTSVSQLMLAGIFESILVGTSYACNTFNIRIRFF